MPSTARMPPNCMTRPRAATIGRGGAPPGWLGAVLGIGLSLASR